MKTKFLLAAVAIMSLVAASCNKENVDPQADQVQTPITITASYAGEGSKVNYSEDGSTIRAYWETGDQIDVVYNGTVNTLSLTGGEGTQRATFSGTISGTPSASSMLICYVRDVDAPAGILTINGDGYTYTPGTFLAQDGTLDYAASLNLYYGVAQYGDGTNISCTFSVNTSMMKFSVQAPATTAGQTATLTYKSGDAELAKATYTVGTGGNNTIYMTIPAGSLSGAQSLVFASGTTNETEVLSATGANFAAGQTYSKNIIFTSAIDLSSVSWPYTAQDGDVLTGTVSSMTHPLMIADGATVTLRNVNLSGNLDYIVGTLGNATIVLEGTNVITNTKLYDGEFSASYPAIYICYDEGSGNKTLTIEGTGSLTASANQSLVIGPYGEMTEGVITSAGNLVINGGAITLNSGSNYAPGIGVLESYDFGRVTINTGITSLTVNGGGWGMYPLPIKVDLGLYFGTQEVSGELSTMTNGDDYYGFHVVKGEHSLTLTPAE